MNAHARVSCLQLSDAKHKRYEVPLDIPALNKSKEIPLMSAQLSHDPFTISVSGPGTVNPM